MVDGHAIMAWLSGMKCIRGTTTIASGAVFYSTRWHNDGSIPDMHTEAHNYTMYLRSRISCCQLENSLGARPRAIAESKCV